MILITSLYVKNYLININFAESADLLPAPASVLACGS